MDWLSGIFNFGKNLIGGLGQLGNKVAQGAGQIGTAGVKAGQQATQSMMPNIMGMFNQGAKPAIQGVGQGVAQQATKAAPAANAFAMPSMSGMGNILSSFMPSGPAAATQNPWQRLNPQQLMGQASKATPTTPMKGGSPLTNILSAFTQKADGGQMNLPQIGAGLALPMIGNMMASKTKIPDLSQNANYQKMQQLQTRNFNQMDPALEQALLRDIQSGEDQEDRQFQATWNSLRPGSDLSNDSTYARAWQEHKDRQMQNRTDTMAKQRFANIQNNLQASQLEMQNLAQLAQMDTYTIMMQLGLDSQEAEDFKSIFSGLGKELISSGTGANDYSGVMKMFGGSQ